jgi:putative Holliday junction resolvase
VSLPAGTLLAFDFGTKRVGVAVGESATRLAHPLETIVTESNDARFDAIAKLVAEWRPVGFVVGQPRHADGGEHEIARLAGKFGRRLEGRFGLPVAFVDETLTSSEAESQLREAGSRRSGKGDVDTLSATLILQGYLDRRAA